MHTELVKMLTETGFILFYSPTSQDQLLLGRGEGRKEDKLHPYPFLECPFPVWLDLKSKCVQEWVLWRRPPRCMSRNEVCDALRKDTKALLAKEKRSSLVPFVTKWHVYLPARTDTCTIFLREKFLLEVKTPSGVARRWGRGRFWATQWIPFGSSRSHPQWLPSL